MKNKTLFVILTMCLFVGCVTPYGKSGMRGGYSDQRLGEDVIRVHFKGNGYTAHEKVTAYLFYRCAEVTLKNGYDYFEILDKNSDKETFNYETSGTYNSTTSVYGGTATTHGTYSPGVSGTATAYTDSLLIKMRKGKKPSNQNNVFAAREILKYLGPEIKK